MMIMLIEDIFAFKFPVPQLYKNGNIIIQIAPVAGQLISRRYLAVPVASMGSATDLLNSRQQLSLDCLSDSNIMLHRL